jgi:hypothetical protein
MVAHDEPTNRLRQWRQTFKRCMGARTDTIRKEIDEPLLIDIISAIDQTLQPHSIWVFAYKGLEQAQ